MNHGDVQTGVIHNVLSRTRAAIGALAFAAGSLLMAGGFERVEAEIPGITTTAKTNCNSLGRGVFRAVSSLDTDTRGNLVAVNDDGVRSIIEGFTVPANDETASTLPLSAEDMNIIFVTNDGRETDPTRNNCLPDETTTTTSTPNSTTSTAVPTTTSSSTSSTTQPAHTTTSTTRQPASTTTSQLAGTTTTRPSSGSSTSSTTQLANPTSPTTLGGGEGNSPINGGFRPNSTIENYATSTTTPDVRKGGAKVLARTGEGSSALTTAGVFLLGLGAATLAAERRMRPRDDS